MSMSDQDRAEIEADIAAQGLDYELTADDVAQTFGLHESYKVPDDDASPSPAFGADWRYSPEPGEEELFADTSDMFLPPNVDQEVGPTMNEPVTDQDTVRG